MSELFALISSMVFLVVSYLAVGWILSLITKTPNMTLAEYFFVGAGTVTIATLLAAIIFPQQLRLISLILLTSGLIFGLGFLIVKSKQTIGSLWRNALWGMLIFAIILPVFFGTYNVRVWGDEMNMEVPLVRQWLANDNFITADDAWYSFYDYPRLWVIMLYQSLLLNGNIHEAAGRWISILTVCFGAMFVARKLVSRFKVNKWAGWTWACFWLALVFGPMFAWSASWYYSIIIEMLVMLAFYYAWAAREKTDEPLNLKFVFIAGLFASMMVGIRPDGFLYLPMLFLILLIGPLASFKKLLKNNLAATLIALIPSVLVFWSWRIFTNIKDLHGDKDPFELAKNIGQALYKLPAVAGEMFQLLVIEWQMSGFWAACLLVSFVLYGLLYKRLNLNERRIIWLLLVPIYKFLILIVENAVFFEDNVRLGRHIMQTAPLLYFVMGFLLYRLVKENFGIRVAGWRRSSKIIIVICLLLLIFGLQISIGMVYTRLPGEMNDYIESWVTKIHNEYPLYNNVPLLIPKEHPETTPVFELWRYYASKNPALYDFIPLEDNAVYFQKLIKREIDAVLLYAPDENMSKSLGLKLAMNQDYLIGREKNRFKVLLSVERPYENIWGVPFRTRAIKAFINDVKFWQ